MLRKLKVAIAGLMMLIILTFLALPPALYFYTIDLVDVMPEKPNVLLSQGEVSRLWRENERCSHEVCSSTTPYWINRWLITALISDNLYKISPDRLQENTSVMASKIALTHMRSGHFKGSGMLWWHLTHAFLGIWVQRNWEENEIASKYAKIDA